MPCDIGSDLTVLEKEVEEKGLPVDLGLVGEDWNSKVSLWIRFRCPVIATSDWFPVIGLGLI